MISRSFPKGLMIAAPQSGSGKTVISLALLRALKMRGVDVRAAKAGPDYIDPAFHAIACNHPSVNLDPWAMTSERCLQLALRQGGSHLLVESMMGFFDGAADGSGSGAQLAGTLGLPVVLVVDAATQSHSIAALVRGFRDHDKTLNICAVILNKVGSVRHETMLRTALGAIDMPVIGAVGRSIRFDLPERHLGLVQAGEITGIEEFIGKAAEEISSVCDLDLLVSCFVNLGISSPVNQSRILPPGQNIAIARDEAFSFIYPHMLEDWSRQGAQISFFSPLANEGPNPNADAVYLPGGYPELHGEKLSNAENFKSTMRVAKTCNALIYGECGGFMVLGEGLIDRDGKPHEMLGFLGLETSFEKRKLHLGYRKLKAKSEFFAGAQVFAHEFHYTSVVKQKGDALFEAQDALGVRLDDQGLREGKIMGSYMHLIEGDKNG